MLSKKSFVLRINPETMKLLEKWAADEFRSTNGQIEYLLQRSLLESKRWKDHINLSDTDKSEGKKS
ncbi:MAG: Arc family DNA binding domain-containing protein [Saprospiraceae bacterium]|uniref:Arc family DNA binding domain-containing protein n=1 Tax=Candidatus Brachybacter algidus TaxID=2982024 RepID=UPI001D25F0EF|nr:Arc family DNA binding domain-containing protein [Candidatus Brachybacter algidus]MBK6450100.1 Arc family DNA binding domain-containing protein [Candidatus Brachybacter algidus]MBK7605216.1 Arc family DNA binding domain-containing protein [Candidatus Brachybacter algidus]MBK8356110.1 Arc family DNA binding domain-containing protein [Candidatus Brachybacter algidus]MBK8603443.1 Arc family DNA binding domain-containing protein [Candidatus Brachybacter algidus]